MTRTASKRRSTRAKGTRAAPSRKRRQANAPGVTRKRLLEAINANPGLYSREYADALRLSKTAVSAASARLTADGLIRKTGQTQATRLFPTGSASGEVDDNAPIEAMTTTAPVTNGNGTNGEGVNTDLLKALGVEPVTATLLGDVLVVDGDVYKIEKARIGASIKG